MEFKSINAEQGIDRVGNRINRIIMEFKSSGFWCNCDYRSELIES